MTLVLLMLVFCTERIRRATFDASPLIHSGSHVCFFAGAVLTFFLEACFLKFDSAFSCSVTLNLRRLGMIRVSYVLMFLLRMILGWCSLKVLWRCNPFTNPWTILACS
jgi:hypothetical protein